MRHDPMRQAEIERRLSNMAGYSEANFGTSLRLSISP